MDLFEKEDGTEEFVPLADRMRPRGLDEFVGQEHLIGEGRALRRAIESGEAGSLIFWGPPGSGKTTLAHIIARASDAYFVSFSAVLSGVRDIREVVRKAEEQRRLHNRKTILFVDEIHRFNKAQQDAFLPWVEKGTIILIGATTENPSFEVISPLLSRAKVYTLNPLTPEEITVIVERALKDERGLGDYNADIDPEAIRFIVTIANGDGRIALNLLEISVSTTPKNGNGLLRINLETVQDLAQRKAFLYDKSGEEHYNLISAFHKSLRGSDPDASLYWLARMLEAGEDPLYIVRRMVRFASEDVGNADPQALQIAVAAKEAVHFIGMPEGNLALAQAAIYLAAAPKSNSTYMAYEEAKEDVEKTFNEPVPLHIRNPVTALTKKLGYGKDYKYPHKSPGAFVKQDYFPENLKGRTYYHPAGRGFEKEIRRRLAYWKKLKEESQDEPRMDTNGE